MPGQSDFIDADAYAYAEQSEYHPWRNTVAARRARRRSDIGSRNRALRVTISGRLSARRKATCSKAAYRSPPSLSQLPNALHCHRDGETPQARRCVSSLR